LNEQYEISIRTAKYMLTNHLIFQLLAQRGLWQGIEMLGEGGGVHC